MNNPKIAKGISIGVRVAALLLMILFFVPSICVSCQGVDAEFSGFNAAVGNIEIDSDYDDDDFDMDDILDEVEPAPWLFIIPVLAVAIGILATKYHFVSMGCAFANIIMMAIFKAAVNGWVDDQMDGYAKVKTLAPFAFHIIICILIILALAFDKFILCNEKNKAWVNTWIDKYIRKVPSSNEEKKIFCVSCGVKLDPDAKFCVSCGTPVVHPTENTETASVETPVSEPASEATDGVDEAQ